ncbi:hypothetical protein ACE6H2_004068 [Prunus campanulata]
MSPISVQSDANSLKNMVNRFRSFNMCQVALRNVDRTIVVMLNRKLEDVMMLNDDVVGHIRFLSSSLIDLINVL